MVTIRLGECYWSTLPTSSGHVPRGGGGTEPEPPAPLWSRYRPQSRSGRIASPVFVVLEGKARDGVPTGVADGVTVLHAQGSGDDMLVSTVSNEADEVTLVTADRELRGGRKPWGLPWWDRDGS